MTLTTVFHSAWRWVAFATTFLIPLTAYPQTSGALPLSKLCRKNMRKARVERNSELLASAGVPTRHARVRAPRPES
jgi:hypothetical protein